MSYGPMVLWSYGRLSKFIQDSEFARRNELLNLLVTRYRVFQTHEFCRHAKTSESDVKYLRKTVGLIKTVLHWFWPDSSCIFWIFKGMFIANKNYFHQPVFISKQQFNVHHLCHATRPPRFFLPTVFWGIQSRIWDRSSSVFQESTAIPRKSDEEAGSQERSKLWRLAWQISINGLMAHATSVIFDLNSRWSSK